MRAAPDAAGHIGGRRARRGGRSVLLLALAAAGVIGATASALAQAPTVPPGNYGGGAVPDPPKPPFDKGAMTISLRAPGDGTLQIRAVISASCGTLAVTPHATIAPDGTFAATGATKRHVSGGGRLRTTYEIQGSITATGATGTASSQNRRTNHGRSRTCNSGTVTWGAARPTGVVGVPGAPVAGARLYGNTRQLFGHLRGSIVLRISDDGTRLTRALYNVRLRCGRRILPNIFDTPKKNRKIGPGGRVTSVEHFNEVLNRHTRVRTTERFTATIGDTGATGTFSITDRLIDRPSGRTFPGGCRSGSVKWTAAR